MTGTFARRATMIAALATFATATAIAHEPGQAGHAGLQVLPKDIPHDQLIAVMKNFSTALGVKCTYCHVAEGTKLNFASDAKPEKATARAMMLMVKRINEQDFKVTDWSKSKVTCYTCHRGAVKPLTSPAPAPSPATPPAA